MQYPSSEPIPFPDFYDNTTSYCQKGNNRVFIILNNLRNIAKFDWKTFFPLILWTLIGDKVKKY